MNNENKHEVEVKITQDKLVDLLLHAATREDIAKLDNKIDALESKLDNKIDALESKLDNKIDALESKLDNKIDALESKLDNKIDALESKLNNSIAALESRLTANAANFENRISSQFKWILGTTLGVGVSLIGVMIGLASFLTH